MTDALLFQCSGKDPEHTTPSQQHQHQHQPHTECSSDETTHNKHNTHTKQMDQDITTTTTPPNEQDNHLDHAPSQQHQQQHTANDEGVYKRSTTKNINNINDVNKTLVKKGNQQRRQAKRRDDKAARRNSNYNKPDTFTNLYRACICIPLFFVWLSAAALTYTIYQHWDPVSSATENPMDVAIDYQTQDLFVTHYAAKRVDVLLGGFLPKIAIFNPAVFMYGAVLMHRICTRTGVLVYGLFVVGGANIEYLPLPLPANPSTGNVPSTIVTAVSGLSLPVWFTQTHNSIELYVAEYSAWRVSHWAVSSPPIGTDGTSAAVPTLARIRNIGSSGSPQVGRPEGAAITSDDNVMLASGYNVNTIYKATPMLPHTATPAVTSLTFTNTVNGPTKLVLHPAHNSASDFILYVANFVGGNILEYNSAGPTDSILAAVSATGKPHGVTIHSNGTLIFATEGGLKTSCCVDSFDYTTQLAGYQAAASLPTAPIQYLDWDPVAVATEGPMDVAIDHQTQDVFVSQNGGRRLVVLLGGLFPKTTIYSPGTPLIGALLMHRTCTASGVNIRGVFFTEYQAGTVRYLPLPLPANPSTSNVPATIVTAASGLAWPHWFTQAHNGVELYVAENNAAKVSHWAAQSPPVGTDGTSAATVSLTRIRDIGSVGSPQAAAITSDDNVLLVAASAQNTIYKATPMLPHTVTPGVTSLTFSNTLNSPRKLTLHPAHNSAAGFILYVGNMGGGNILAYDSTSATDRILVTASAAAGYQPHGVTIHSNGSLIIPAQDGLKTSCCVDSFDYSTQLAGYMSASCSPSGPVQYPNWDPVSSENPTEVVIDHQTQDVFVPFASTGKRLEVLLGGFSPKITIFTSASALYGAVLMHRICTFTGVLIYGVFFVGGGNMKYLPLPLPANPSEANVGPTIVTAVSGLAGVSCWMTQTHNSIELYLAEYGGNKVSHWSVSSPPSGTDGTSAAVPTLARIRNIGSVGAPQGVAITSDDNVLLVAAYTQNSIKKVTPMLQHSATRAVTSLTFTNTISSPQKLTLHPAHNSASDFILYVKSTGGNILEYNSTSATDSILVATGGTPHGVTVHPNGTLIIVVTNGLKTSCCVDSFDYTTQDAGYQSASCLPTSIVQYLHWDPVSSNTENPEDVAIDHQTQDVFVAMYHANRGIDVLLGGFLPKTTIYSGASTILCASLIHRLCTRTGVLIYGLFFTEYSAGNIKYLPLPLPANPSTGNVGPTVVTAASGLSNPHWFSQTHNSIEIYLAEYGGFVSHWSVCSPPIGTNGTSTAVPTLARIRNIGSGSVGNPSGAAITSDDNVLLVSANAQNLIYKVTPMLPHGATPTVTSLTFSNTINNPQKIALHPAHNSATDFILYIGNILAGNILAYDSTSATDSILVTVSATSGYRPHGVTIHSNGSLIIFTEDGLKTSCCVDSFDYSTQLAGYMSATCLPTAIEQYLHWDPVNDAVENPSDVAIDHQTQDIFVTYYAKKSVDVLLGGFLPKTSIYSSAYALIGIILIHRTSTTTGVLVYGLLWAEMNAAILKYLPLPLPANPSTGNVGPTAVTVATGVSDDLYLSQTHNSIEIYVGQWTPSKVGHYSVSSPPVGTDGTSAAIPTLAKIRDIPGVGKAYAADVTSDDNVLLVCAEATDEVRKATPLLPHSGTPIVTTLTFSNTLSSPRTIALHPTHNSATDFILYVGNFLGGNILMYNSASATDSILLPVSTTAGFRPKGITIHPNGTLIIAAEDGLKTSCCVDSFDYTTQLAGYMSATCLPTAPVEYTIPVAYLTEGPEDAVIDHQTQDVYVGYYYAARLDVLLGGFLPKIAINTGGATRGGSLIHRICTLTGVLIYGLFFIEYAGNVKYLPLPLPANPTTSNVPSTIVTAASGLSGPTKISQAHNSIEVYVAERTGAKVSHWAVHSPPQGTEGTSAATVSLTRIRDIGSVGNPFGVDVTSDDNVAFVAGYTQNTIYKATPLLPRSGSPIPTSLTFTNTLSGPYKATLHPAHNSATDFILYIVNSLAGNILKYDSASATDMILRTVSPNPAAVTIYPNGTLLIAAATGLQTSCCVDSFDYSTQFAGYKNAVCLPTALVQYLHWDPVSSASENPMDVTIDYQTQHVLFTMYPASCVL